MRESQTEGWKLLYIKIIILRIWGLGKGLDRFHLYSTLNQIMLRNYVNSISLTFQTY